MPVLGIGEVAGAGQIKTTDVDYAMALRKVNARLEAPHVIKDAHVKAAIKSLVEQGQAITPYLLKLLGDGSKTGAANGQGGWPFWAVVCGTLSKVGGEEGAPR